MGLMQYERKAMNQHRNQYGQQSSSQTGYQDEDDLLLDDFDDFEDPPIKKKSGWKILGMIVSIPLVLILFVVSSGLLYELTAEELPVTANDKLVLLTFEDFADWELDVEKDQGTETFIKQKYFDDTYYLEYEFEAADFYVFCSVDVDTSASGAEGTYFGAEAGTSIALGLEDAEMRERNDLLTWGDESKCALLIETKTNGTYGNYFIARNGKYVIELFITGVYFDGPGDLEELLKPVLDKLSAYQPE
jgi:hypothetical protein